LAGDISPVDNFSDFDLGSREPEPSRRFGADQLFFDVTAYTLLQIRSTLVPPQ
jgi:hypothetical protein